MNNVTKIETSAVPETIPQRIPTPMDLLTQAVANGNIELAEKLMTLQERWEKNQSVKAFNNAMAEAKAEMPVILKERSVEFDGKSGGKTSYKYEDLAGIAKVVDPVLTKHGLRYRYRTESKDGIITVTCVVSHKDGHSEENSLPAPPDTSGAKNNIQAVGSTVTYLQRYTLKAALGLAASTDTDASDVGRVPISDEQYNDLMKLADEVGADKIAFCKLFKIDSLKDMPARRLPEAIAVLNVKKKAKAK